MAGSPGGAEAGRVSVKVVPDTSKFAQELKAQLAKLDEDFAVDVGLNTAKASAEFKAFKQRIESDEINAKLDLNTSRLGAQARGASGFLRGLTSSITGMFRQLGKVGTSLVGVITSISGSAGSFTASVGKMGGALGGLAISVAQVALRMGALMAIVSVVGGAIMSLAGAITAALGGLPVVLASAGAGIAALALGMEGIKTAAKTLEPQITSLKESLSSTFQEGLTPVFERLRAVFPALQEGLNGVANGLVDMASQMVNVVTSSEGIENIRSALDGVQVVISFLTDSFTELFDEMLKIAGMDTLYLTLGATIGGLTDKFTSFLEEIRKSGQLEAGLVQLQNVLLGVSDVLSELSIAALDFFVAAGPGISEFFRGLADAISKVDWTKLGASFGDVFGKLGEWLANIDQEMMDRLVNAFAQLGMIVAKMIEDGTFDSLLNGFIMFVDFIPEILAAVFSVIAIFQVLKNNLEQFSTWWSTKWNQMKETFSQWGENISKAAGDAWREVQRIVHEKVNQVKAKIDEIKEIPGKVRRWFTEMQQAVREKIDEAVRKVREFPQKAKSALSNLGSTLWSSGTSLIQGFIDGIKAKIQDVRNAASRVVSAARAYFPFSPAKEGPFSGTGYTLYSGRALAEDWAEGIRQGTSTAVRAVDNMMNAANDKANAEWRGHISSDSFGGLSGAVHDGVLAAFNGSKLSVDGNGMARVVNQVNAKNNRR